MLEKIAIFCKNLLDWFKSDRCFVKYFIDAFPLANNLLLLTIVILGIFIVSMYMVAATQFRIAGWMSLLVIILLSSVLASGIFYSIKTNIDKRNDDEAQKSDLKDSLSTFYTGVGEYYLHFIGLFVLFFALATLVIFGTVLVADTLLCPVEKLGLRESDLFTLMAYPSQMDAFIQNLDITQKMGIRAWTRAFMISTQTFTFIVMLWIPEVLYTKKNIFTAFFGSIKKLFLNFPNSLCVYLTILFLNYLLALFILIFGQFSLVVFLLNIASLYLLIYNFYAIFLYYKDINN